MPDTKQLELEAQNYVASKLTNCGILVAQPNFDINGSDLLAIIRFHDHSKFIRVQSKGRSFISSTVTNIKIPTQYVTDSFVVFLYIKTSEFDKDYLYCFLASEILTWGQTSENYVLNITRNNFESKLANFQFSLKRSELVKEVIRKANIRDIYRSLSNPSPFEEAWIDLVNALEDFGKAWGQKIDGTSIRKAAKRFVNQRLIKTNQALELNALVKVRNKAIWAESENERKINQDKFIDEAQIFVEILREKTNLVPDVNQFDEQNVYYASLMIANAVSDVGLFVSAVSKIIEPLEKSLPPNAKRLYEMSQSLEGYTILARVSLSSLDRDSWIKWIRKAILDIRTYQINELRHIILICDWMSENSKENLLERLVVIENTFTEAAKNLVNNQ